MDNMYVHWTKEVKMNQWVIPTVKLVSLFNFQPSPGPVRPVQHVLKQRDRKGKQYFIFIS